MFFRTSSHEVAFSYPPTPLFSRYRCESMVAPQLAPPLRGSFLRVLTAPIPIGTSKKVAACAGSTLVWGRCILRGFVSLFVAEARWAVVFQTSVLHARLLSPQRGLRFLLGPPRCALPLDFFSALRCCWSFLRLTLRERPVPLPHAFFSEYPFAGRH